MNINISNLRKTYSTGKVALDGIQLQLKSPNLVGLLGPNGAGKSTLMKLLVAELLPSAGSITIDGRPLLQQETQMKAHLGYLPQAFGLYEELTVWQFLDYMTALKGIRNRHSAIQEALQATHLTAQKKAPIRSLSGGQRQRVGIAQAILGNPQLLIFDEPTVGLDPEERIHFRNFFSQMAQDRLVLLSTHIIEDVQSVCSQLVVLHQGRILFTGPPSALICLAQGHVGILEETNREWEAGLSITSRVNTARGIACRAVAEELPRFAEPVEPTLEDAYLYLISREVAQ